MSIQQGSLSRQAAIRLRAGDLLLRGFDNEEIMEILEVSLSSVQRWRKKVESVGLTAICGRQLKSAARSSRKVQRERW